MKKLCIGILVSLVSHFLLAQSNGYTQLKLTDLSDFQSQSGNWQNVGEVTIDPYVDIHQENVESTQKRRKKNQPASRQAVMVESGSGILVNLPSEDKKSNLLTSWEHGDIELDLEVMLPKGSNSGLYLQGRYEIQLFDSYGVRSPKYSDIGGIYRNWESAPDKSYMGKAPLTNAAKAPGLWQRLQVSFRAPRFDESGDKIENARIVKAILNGVTIHDNVEIPLLTGGPVQNNEVAMGPIMIQGDHGAVAIRNFKYKLMHDLDTELSDITYEVFHGTFETFSEVLAADNPVTTGQQSELTWEIANRENDFAIRYKGTLQITEDADYIFSASVGGQALLKVAGEEVASGWRNFSGTKNLQAGEYPIEFMYFKTRSWMDPFLGLTISSPTGHEKALSAFSSHPSSVSAVAPILIRPQGSQPRLLRAFLDFEGDRDRRITHSIGVGSPTGVNYVYDLQQGNLACVWKGDFVNATPMWNDRGDGSFRPLGMIQYLYLGQSIAGEIRSKGYTVDSETGFPTFNYEVNGQQVSDQVSESDSKVIREVSLTGVSGRFEVTESSAIERMENGLYAVGDKEYYIELMSGQSPEIIQEDGVTKLVLPIDSNPIKYAIIW